MDDEILSFEQHRQWRAENADMVHCARCGKSIPAIAIRCPECGVHFDGEAQDYLHPTERSPRKRAGWVIVAAILLLVAFVVSILSMR